MTPDDPTTAGAVAVGERWQHVKRGTSYEVIGIAELQAAQLQGDHAQLAIYRGEDGKLWARNTGEFTDGRFVRIAATAVSAAQRPVVEIDPWEGEAADGPHEQRLRDQRLLSVPNAVGHGIPISAVLAAPPAGVERLRGAVDWAITRLTNTRWVWASAIRAELSAALAALPEAPARCEGEGLREDEDSRLRLAVWNAVKQAGGSDEAGYAAVRAVRESHATLRPATDAGGAR